MLRTVTPAGKVDVLDARVNAVTLNRVSETSASRMIFPTLPLPYIDLVSRVTFSKRARHTPMIAMFLSWEDIVVARRW